MKEPTTVKQAKQLTLDKIRECMELPIRERWRFWVKPRWVNRGNSSSYCAFCFLGCPCIADEICDHLENVASNGWLIKDLRKLYRMVEAIEC